MANNVQASAPFSDEPIAVIGIACEFAGGIHSPKDLWRVLDESIDISSVAPTDRLNADLLALQLENSDKAISQGVARGYFVDSNLIEQFDPKFFGITDGDALLMDPSHRILLQKFVHLSEDAGYSLDRISHTKTGVFIGQAGYDHIRHCSQQYLESHPPALFFQTGIYNASARLAYHFDLHGPNLTIDTACASSMSALQLSVNALRNGEANMVVAGGTQLNYAYENMVNIFKSMAVSVDGRSHVFSEDANGFAKSDGIALVLLKRLSDAIKSNDHIYCVIREAIISHDGNLDKPAYSVPSSYGQYRMLNAIYSRAQIDPKQIFYVECHGTGTQAGDPIEANTLGKFFSRTNIDPPLLIGSIKSNIGHTEGTAGVASLIKVALCMRYRRIPPNMNFSELNPKIFANQYNLHVVTRHTYFPSINLENPVMMGLSGYGIGGNSTHCIVMEWTKPSILQSTTKQTVNGFGKKECIQGFVLPFSAKSRVSLRHHAKAVLEWLSVENLKDVSDQEFLFHLSRKLLLQRTLSFDYQVSFVAKTIDQFKDQLKAFHTNHDDSLSSDIVSLHRSKPSEGINPLSIAFVFSGQGPQWWAMGRQLYHSEPVFRQWINRIDERFAIMTRDWRLIDELLNATNEEESRINETNIAQPALFAVQVALAAVWYSWNIHPTAIIGHSMGEVAAAFVARQITLTDAVKIIYHRARLQHRNTRQNGRMLALGMSEDDARTLLTNMEIKDVSIAAINSGQSITLSGDADMLENVRTIVTTIYPTMFCAWLRVENAFHSHQMDRFHIREDLLESLKDLHVKSSLDEMDLFDVSPVSVRLYSTVKGDFVDENCIFNAEYWWKNIREAVQFHRGFKALINDQPGMKFIVEISPHPVLAAALREILPSTNITILASLKRKLDEQTTMLAALTHFELNAVQWTYWLATRHYAAAIESDEIEEYLWTLPNYTFDKISCWYETKESVIARRATRSVCHPLLGVRMWNEIFSTWVNEIDLARSQFRYLLEHRIQGDILLAGACFIEMALAAGRELANSSAKSITLENVNLSQALILSENERTELRTIVSLASYEFHIYSRRSQKEDYVRKDGMASSSLLDSFTDKRALNTYAAERWKLHASGSIVLDRVAACKSVSISHLREKVLNEYTRSLESTEYHQLYASFDLRGYFFGPTFRRIRRISTTRSLVLSEVENVSDNDRYLIHPTLIDACFQSAFLICPQDYVFVPVSFGKITMNLNKDLVQGCVSINAIMSARPVLHGFTGDEEFSFDGYLFTSDSLQDIITIENFRIQKISEVAYVDCSTYFDRLNKNAWLPGKTKTESKKEVDTILNHFCIQPVWTKMILPVFHQTLPSPSELCSTDIEGVPLRTLLEQVAPYNDMALARFMSDIGCLTFQYVIRALHKVAECRITDREILRNETRKMLSPFHQNYIDVLMRYDYSALPSTINDYTIYCEQRALTEKYPEMLFIIKSITKSFRDLSDILLGKLHALQWLFSPTNEKLLAEIYQIITKNSAMLSMKILLNYLLSSKSSQSSHLLRVLEVGGGVGGTTIYLLECIIDFANTSGFHVEYVFTDISPSFFSKVQQRLAKLLEEKNTQNLVRISYEVLDIDESPLLHQSLELESFDIVCAVNVIHATKNVVNSIQHVRHFLAPGGLLKVIELTKSNTLFDFVFGLLPQWWISSDDAPVRKAGTRSIMDISQWRQAFELTTGFHTLDHVCNQLCIATIFAQKSSDIPVLMNLPERQQKAWVIFYDANEHQFTRDLNSSLKQKDNNTNVELVLSEKGREHVQIDGRIMDIPSCVQHLFKKYKLINIIFAWALDPRLNFEHAGEFLNAQEEICLALSQVFQSIVALKLKQKPKLFIVTSNAQSNAGENLNPAPAPIIGFIRSFQNEYQEQRVKLIDLQMMHGKCITPSLIENLVIELCLPISSIFADQEIVLAETEDGGMIRYVFDYQPMASDQAQQHKILDNMHPLIEPSRDYDHQPFAMEIPPSKLLHDLQWISTKRPNHTRISDDQVIVRVHCVGLNFRDLLLIEDLYPQTYSIDSNHNSVPNQKIATEFSGTILEVGSRAGKNFAVGDRVCGGYTGALIFSSHATVDQYQIVKVPDHANLSFEELASIPVGLSTVILALKERMTLLPEHTCLIHSAAGGFGLTAVHYCRMIGVRMIVTAGTEEKRQYLREHYNLEHVFNSRDLSFVEEVQRIIPNGVDVIINSLSEPYLSASLNLLAPHGHFIELGRRDTYGNTRIKLFNLREDCSFHVIDLLAFFMNYTQRYQQLLTYGLDLITSRRMSTVSRITVFEPAEIITALKTFKKGLHIGKLILRVTESNQFLRLTPCSSAINSVDFSYQLTEELFTPSTCEGGTILITGGLGAVGLAMTSWMIKERGVKSVVLVGRNTVHEIDRSSRRWRSWLELQHTAGLYQACVQTVKADVSNFDQVREIIESINKTARPLCGIIHGAVVVHDALVEKMTPEVLKKTIRPRIRGAWNLHRATASLQLKFFILLSSTRNHRNDVGGSNYNAGNQFYDIFAHWRRHVLGLPSLSVNLPAISNTEFFSEKTDWLLEMYRHLGEFAIPSNVSFELIERFHQMQYSLPFTAPIIYTCDWNSFEKKHEFIAGRFRSIVKTQATKMEELRHGDQYSHSAIGEQELAMSNSMNNHVDAVLLKIRSTVAKLFGSTDLDRIDIEKPLSQQGMDSLMIVSLHNWLAKQVYITIPVIKLVQGMSIMDIIKYIKNKSTSTELQDNMSQQENTIDLSEKSTSTMDTMSPIDMKMQENQMSPRYQGTSLIVSISTKSRNPKVIFHPILFCLSDMHMIDAVEVFSSLAQQMDLFAELCVISRAQWTLLTEYITQMRRVQPCGSYYLLAHGSSVDIGLKILDSLKTHRDADVKLLALLYPPNTRSGEFTLLSKAPDDTKMLIVQHDNTGYEQLLSPVFSRLKVHKLSTSALTSTLSDVDIREIAQIIQTAI